MSGSAGGNSISLFLCGDVMTGRGIDQILPYPGDPTLYEPYMKNAEGYVKLAERASGPIPQPAGFAYIWGEALAELDLRRPDARIINLETSITRSDDCWRGKSIHYRMNPDNIPCLTVARIDICALANNHTLDWGYPGLADTLAALEQAKIKTAGAGRNLREAEEPAALEVPGRGRVLVFSFGMESSGVPREWAASGNRAGVNFLDDSSGAAVRRIRDAVLSRKRPGDAVIASIHWGGNWGYDVSRRDREIAHRAIDEAGVDLVHGHSSHHVKGIEVYQGKLILYGCGDFLNDYEGIGGYDSFRGDLGCMYFADVDPSTGFLVRLRVTPTRVRRLQVTRAAGTDASWLESVLNREGRKFGTRVNPEIDGILTLRWE